MSWDVQLDLPGRTLSLTGELTIFSVLDIRQRMHDAFTQCDELTVDLGGVTDIDTAGLQLMLLAKRKSGKAVHFTRHSDVVLRLIDLANLGQLLGAPLIYRAQ